MPVKGARDALHDSKGCIVTALRAIKTQIIVTLAIIFVAHTQS